MSDLSSFPAFVQAIGVVAMYAFMKEVIPKILGKNGNSKNRNDTLTITQHDKECTLKLGPIKDQVVTLHNDFRFYMRSQGVMPPSDED